MKVLAFILSIVLVTVLVTGAVVLVVLTGPSHSGVLILLVAFAVGVFCYGPLALGSAAFYWDFGASDGSRRYFRRFLQVLVAAEILGGVALVAYWAIARSPWWVPTVLIVLGVVLAVLAPIVGRAVRRYDDAHGKPAPAWRQIEPAVIRRKIRAIAITFAIALVVSLIALVLLATFVDDAGRIFGAAVGFALEFSCFAAAFAAIIVSLSLAQDMRTATGRDISATRRIAKVVLRGKPLELSESEQVGAAKYAAAAAVYLPFLLAFFALLYAGLLTQRVIDLSSERSELKSFDVVLIVILVVVLIALLPLQIARTRRARRYAEAHADLIIGEPVTPQ